LNLYKILGTSNTFRTWLIIWFATVELSLGLSSQNGKQTIPVLGQQQSAVSRRNVFGAVLTAGGIAVSGFANDASAFENEVTTKYDKKKND
jgi:hypothetical protein